MKNNVQDREFHFVLGAGMVVDQSFFWAAAEVSHSVCKCPISESVVNTKWGKPQTSSQASKVIFVALQ